MTTPTTRDTPPSPPLTAFHSISWTTDVVPQLQMSIVVTGSFVVAWGWDLCLYSLSHAAAGVNPLQNEIGFGDDNERAPKYLIVLLAQYLLVCGAAAALSTYMTTHLSYPWNTSAAAVRAVEFIPSPVFAGKLMAWLSQFSQLGTLQRGILDLLVVGACAVLAQTLPDDPRYLPPFVPQRFTPVVRETLGFGLGIAWNVFLGQLLGPKTKHNKGYNTEFDLIQFIAMGGYLAIVSLLAFRVAALKHETNSTTNNSQSATPSTTNTSALWQRYCDLASFAMAVVCAFTTVDFMGRFMFSEWYGTLQGMALLLLVSAVLNALVASVDLEALRAQALVRQQQQEQQDVEDDNRKLRHSPWTCILWIPCCWCCCPWIPVLVLLAHVPSSSGATTRLKQDWYALIALVTGLAASIEASNLVTTVVNTLASSFCTAAHCPQPWLFCMLQIVVAAVTTVILLPALGPLCQAQDSPATADEGTAKPSASQDSRAAAKETQPLLSV